MIRSFGLVLLALPAATVIPAVSAQAQFYPPQPYYRGSPPPGVYQGGLPASSYYIDDDDDDAPVVRRPQRRERYSQNPQAYPSQGQPGAPGRILAYPNDADAAVPPPGFATPDGRPVYGHQLESQQQSIPVPPAARNDPDAIRPPGSIGNANNAPNNPPPGVTPQSPATASLLPPEDQPEVGAPKELPANLKKQLVDYATKEPAGTIVIDTPNTYLYLVLGGGKAMRYGIGVGREGFTWSGTERISKMAEWPDWHPPAEMIDRQPYLPRFMAGGNGNPLGARALYLGKTLYRIHGTNQPSTIGTTVSSGCIRLINQDIEDLFSRVQVGSRVVVLPGKAPDTVATSGNPAANEPANPMAPPPRPGA
ncbi:MAG: L,D-transpeptidase family protein, partial [Pseudolabrys sp.]